MMRLRVYVVLHVQVQQIAPLLDIKKYRSNEVVGSPGKVTSDLSSCLSQC